MICCGSKSVGKVRRVHGGVFAVGISAEKPFIARRRLNAEAKQRIAQVAARLLRPGEAWLH